MTIQEALKQSNKIRRTAWLQDQSITADSCGIFKHRECLHKLTKSELLATDWEPVIEKKKMYKALCGYEGNYYEPSMYYESGEQVKRYYPDFIRLLPHTEIEV